MLKYEYTINRVCGEKELTVAGTEVGGIQAAKTNKSRHGRDFYSRIGAIGGRKSRGGGFAANRELASRAGRKGGKISRRSKA